jgi:hypothetical protein
MATITSESQKVLYTPIRGTEAAATTAPRVGRPPVKANQNHPAAEPLMCTGVTVCAHTKNPKAKSG